MVLKSILLDFREAFNRRHAIIYFGSDDIAQQYKRTTLGPIWLICTTCFWVLSMAIVMAALFNQPISSFLPHAAIGLFVWTFMSYGLYDGCNVFVAAGPLISGTRLPLLFHPMRAMVRYLLLYAHYLGVYLLFMFCIGRLPSAIGILSLLGVAIQIPTVFGVLLMTSVLNARYRDVMPLSGMVCQVMPLLTPIAWQSDMVKRYSWLFKLNPIYHFIEIVRRPLLGAVPEMLSYAYSVGMMLVSLVVGLLLFSRARARLIFWVS